MRSVESKSNWIGERTTDHRWSDNQTGMIDFP